MLEIPIQERKPFKVELATANASTEKVGYKAQLNVKSLKSNHTFLLKNIVCVEKVARHIVADSQFAIIFLCNMIVMSLPFFICGWLVIAFSHLFSTLCWEKCGKILNYFWHFLC